MSVGMNSLYQSNAEELTEEVQNWKGFNATPFDVRFLIDNPKSLQPHIILTFTIRNKDHVFALCQSIEP